MDYNADDWPGVVCSAFLGGLFVGVLVGAGIMSLTLP